MNTIKYIAHDYYFYIHAIHFRVYCFAFKPRSASARAFTFRRQQLVVSLCVSECVFFVRFERTNELASGSRAAVITIRRHAHNDTFAHCMGFITFN